MTYIYLMLFVLVIVIDFLIGYFIFIPVLKKALKKYYNVSIILSKSKKFLIATIWTFVGIILTYIFG